MKYQHFPLKQTKECIEYVKQEMLLFDDHQDVASLLTFVYRGCEVKVKALTTSILDYFTDNNVLHIVRHQSPADIPQSRQIETISTPIKHTVHQGR
jgi:hypothetical protein